MKEKIRAIRGEDEQRLLDLEKIGGDLKDQLILKCQENPWLKVGGEMFEDDPDAEEDYKYCFSICPDIDSLKDAMMYGNWAIRQGFSYKNLHFILQVNGGDEWWTLKEFRGKLIAFDSITFKGIIIRGEFEDYINRLLEATKEQCNNLEY